MKTKHFTRPLLGDNPITVQILGLCSALAVTSSVRPALIMAASVIVVLVFSNVAVSLLRRQMPQSIRLILQVTLTASAVIVVDEVLKTYVPDVSEILSVFVGLIITNCIILGRAEAFAMHNPPLASLGDALGNGFGYAWILIAVAMCRELFGAGSVLDIPILPLAVDGGWYAPNAMMRYAPSGFFLIGFLIWGVNALRRRKPR
jgi:Na+-transporting NADH:ubiquinone oxidoreductase subunit D